METPYEIIPFAWQVSPSANAIARAEVRVRAEAIERFLVELQERIKGVRSGFRASLERLAPEWISYMVRSKDGFTKEEAKKLFYKFRQKKAETPEEEPEPDKPEDTDARFERIMAYMEETSKKLDRIEDDITYLKEQVSDILKRL